MAEALRSLALPPQPNPDQQGALSGGGPVAPQPSPPMQQPAPSHQQVVASLRHFAAIGKQLEIALKDPDLGKSDIKDKVIDGMTTLVADRIIDPREAVSQLTTFPDRPFEQKQWLLRHLQKVMMARNAILDHHRVSNLPAAEVPPTPSGDNHMQDMAGMMQAHYPGKPNG